MEIALITELLPEIARTLTLAIEANVRPSAPKVLRYDHPSPQQGAAMLISIYEAAANQRRTGTPPAGEAGAAPDPGEAPGVAAPPTRIVIVDDHALVRDGLTSLIHQQPDMQVVGQAGTLREAITLARHLHPDLRVPPRQSPA